MPIYSNVAFQILAYAIEGITNKTYPEAFRSAIMEPLNLTNTYITAPNITEGLNAIIPGGEIESQWAVAVGDGSTGA